MQIFLSIMLHFKADYLPFWWKAYSDWKDTHIMVYTTAPAETVYLREINYNYVILTIIFMKYVNI